MVHVSATIVGWNHTTYHKARARKLKDCFSHSAITNKTFGLPTLPEETSSLQMASGHYPFRFLAEADGGGEVGRWRARRGV